MTLEGGPGGVPPAIRNGRIRALAAALLVLVIGACSAAAGPPGMVATGATDPATSPTLLVGGAGASASAETALAAPTTGLALPVETAPDAPATPAASAVGSTPPDPPATPDAGQTALPVPATPGPPAADPTPGPTPAANPIPTTPDPPAAGPAASDRTSYDVTATYDVVAHLDYGASSLRVATRIHLTNTSGGPLGRIALNTVAARLGSLHLLSASVDGTTVHPQVTGQTLIVSLPATLPAGGSSTISVSYRAVFRHDTGGSDWLWSETGGVVAAYRFIPWVSRQTRFERPNSGDPFVTPVSPSVHVTITSDRAMRFATSGRRTSVSGFTQTFTAQNVRDFNFTASPTYHVLQGTSEDGKTQISVFTRWGNASRMLAMARRAIARYEQLIAPYPYPTFTIAQTAGGFAMESPALIWVPHTDSEVDYAVAHETGHQWFYAAVGNDQATNEFADEALTDVLARTLMGNFRASRCASSRLDLSIYQYSGACYYEIVYIQGGDFLDQLRKDMGSAAFWATLRQYYAANLFGISSDKRVLEALRAAAGDWVLPRYHQRFPSLY